MKETVTAIVLARDEELRIGACLASLSWADEIVVVDNESSDRTVPLARQLGATVISSPEKNFSALRQVGAAHAKSRWLLYVDADEIASPELSTAIRNAIADSGHREGPAGYTVLRKNYYFGTYPWPAEERILRLMRRDRLIRWQGTLHETAEIRGETGHLPERLLHSSHRALSEMVRKTNDWSDEEAALRLQSQHPSITWWRLFRVMATGFLGSFMNQRGWKAGIAGVIESCYQGYSLFITYAKLWELQERERLRKQI